MTASKNSAIFHHWYYQLENANNCTKGRRMRDSLLLPFHLFYAFYRKMWAHPQPVWQSQGGSSRFPWAELFPQWYLWRRQWHGCYLIGEHAALPMPAFNNLSCVHLLSLYPVSRGDELKQRTVHFISYPDALSRIEICQATKSVVGKQDIVCGL